MSRPVIGVEASGVSVTVFFQQLTAQLNEAEPYVALACNNFDLTVARRALIEQCKRIAAMEGS